MSQPRFIADNMLGTLARKLRLLGLDVEYLNSPRERELEYLIRSQNRVLLTKDRALARTLGKSAWMVSGENFRDEFLSIAERLAPFSDDFVPFSRCLDCNERLEHIEPSQVKERVPPYISQSKKIFSRCPSCGKIFWEGTHSERMGEEVEWMKAELMRE